MESIKTAHGVIELPAFMPDATYGAVKSVSFKDLKKANIDALVTTTLHIEQKIGSLKIKEFGGIHKFMGWDRPILTDSGGWQVFSLINSSRGNKNNKITELGCSFIDPATGKYSLLTPESSITIQANLDPDIVTVLDDPIVGSDTLSARKRSVQLTTVWAKRSKAKFDLLYNSSTSKPLIGAVIQGGDDFQLRKQSAEELQEVDFDIYNFGGIPMHSLKSWRNDGPKGFYKEMLEYVSDLIPSNKIKYAMGVGQPVDIAFCIDVGWNLFDTVLPTRNARHGYLYVSSGQGDEEKSYYSKRLRKLIKHDVMHLKSKRYEISDEPIDENCSCEACKTVSRAYLRHLIRIKEASGLRLATIHNLSFYSSWVNQFRGS